MAQLIKFYDYILINGIKVKSIIVDNNDMSLLFKQCLKYGIPFENETLYHTKCIYKDAIEAIKPSYSTEIKANIILKCDNFAYNAFEVRDSNIPCFDYIGKTKNGYIVSIKEGYQYTYDKNNRRLLIE